MSGAGTGRKIKGGILFAIEGIDGAGKTTQAEMLEIRLKKAGFDVIRLHEPTSSEWGMKIREMANNGRNVKPEVELEYFLKDRKEDVDKNIKPALDRGAIVIMDRYYLSNVAYQGALEIDIDLIFKKNKFAPVPDIFIILDLAPKVGLSRVRKRENGRPNHFEDPDYLRDVREIFLQMEHRLPNVQCINASRPLGQVTDNIWNICYAYIQKRMEQLANEQ